MNRKTEIRNKILTALIVIIGVAIFIYLIYILSNSNFSSESGDSYKKSKQKKALERAYEKILTGEELSPTEQREWDTYKKWEWQQYDKENYK